MIHDKLLHNTELLRQKLLERQIKNAEADAERIRIATECEQLRLNMAKILYHKRYAKHA